VAESPDDKKMPLLEHLVELRRRLIYSFVAFILAFLVCYHFSQAIFAFLVRPLADALKDQQNAHMIFTALHEAFFTYLKVAFWAAMFVSFPVVAAQLWMFVAPGLYRNERRAFLPFLAATPVLFFLGATLVYYVIFPLAWQFFLSFQTMQPGEGALPIEVAPKVDQYLSLSMQLIFAFGLGFELPVLLLLLVRAGIVSAAVLAKQRRYAIVGAFIAAAVLTPPDVLSQFSLAIPLIILYEISVIGGRMIERSRAAREAEEAANDAVV
jgi:sec-independent protein translocase protein TatC